MVAIASGAYLLGAFFIFPKRSESNCPAHKLSKAGPFALGALTGIAPCPPLVGAIVRALGISNPLLSLTLFGGFFAASSVFIVPAAALSPFLKSGRAANIGRITILIVSVWLIIGGIIGLAR
jgi:sulfite exporter TauE/SafE